MTDQEADYVVTKGMADLAVSTSRATADQIVKTSVGSPSILQYLSLEVAEAAFPRTPRSCNSNDVQSALRAFVETKEARLYRAYLGAVETVGEFKYRKQILRAMAESEDEYVTMEMIRTKVSEYLRADTPSTTLSGPLRQLKEERYGPVLNDVERPDGVGRLTNFTTFKDPALKAFIRLQLLRETEAGIGS